jgi:hypothetical protein
MGFASNPVRFVVEFVKCVVPFAVLAGYFLLEPLHLFESPWLGGFG